MADKWGIPGYSVPPQRVYASPPQEPRLSVDQSIPESSYSAEDMAGLGSLTTKYVAERWRRQEFTVTTVRSQRWVLTSFVRSVGESRRPTRVTRRHIERWLEQGGHAPATKRTHLSIVRAFFDWCIDQGYVRVNPTNGVRKVRQPRTVPRALKAAEVAKALQLADTRGRAIMTLMVQEGLRAQEVSGLEVGDVDLDAGTLFVRKGKGGHERVLPLLDEARQAVSNYLAECPPNGAGALIRSNRDPGQGLTPHYISHLVGGWLHEAGVKDAGHALRHTMASDMLERGANIRNVQFALGHANLNSTQRYLKRMVGDLRSEMGGRSYLNTNGSSPTAAITWLLAAVLTHGLPGTPW